MSTFELPIDSVIEEILSENRQLALQAAMLRSAVTETRKKIDELSAQVNEPREQENE